jgi:hypothetical protein
VNPGRAVLISVGTLTVMYAFFTFAYQGAVRWGALLAHGGNALVMIGIGVVLMIVARARHQTDYFSRPVEAYQPGQPD